MTARQQIARLLPLVLLVILVVAGLRGEVAAPRWNGPLKADGVAIGLALEVILGALLIVTLRRDAAARRRGRPAALQSPRPPDIEPPPRSVHAQVGARRGHGRDRGGPASATCTCTS